MLSEASSSWDVRLLFCHYGRNGSHGNTTENKHPPNWKLKSPILNLMVGRRDQKSAGCYQLGNNVLGSHCGQMVMKQSKDSQPGGQRSWYSVWMTLSECADRMKGTKAISLWAIFKKPVLKLDAEGVAYLAQRARNPLSLMHFKLQKRSLEKFRKGKEFQSKHWS